MIQPFWRTAIALGAMILAAATPTHAQTTPEQACQSGKNRVAGKYAACRQSAEAKLVASGDTSKYGVAIAKCETKFTTGWLKLDTKAAAHGTSCPDAPLTTTQFKTAIDQHSAGIATALAGGGLSDCPSDLATCTADLATCNTTLGDCGNLVKDGVESCDGSDLGGTSCASLGFLGGGLACNAACKLDTTGCVTDLCGNGARDGIESCDGSDLGGADCLDFGFGGGSLACDGSCRFATGGCTPATLCGNAGIDGTEQCDQSNLNGATCATQGFAGGALACGVGCLLDTGGCWSAPRFVDNGDGSITDKQTGLMWEKKIQLDGTPSFAALHDADNEYPWAGTCTVATTKYCQPTAAAAAACATGVDGPATGCAECNGGSEGTCNVSATVWTFVSELNGAGFAGHGDWRIPGRDELEEIVDYADTSPPMIDILFHGSSCGGACTSLALPACSCTQYGPYWESATFANPPTDAFYTDFNDGTRNLTDEANLQFVRAVRTLP